MSWTHAEPRSVQDLNETIFLVTYTLGIIADEIGSAVEKIEDWLGKPVVITCDEVTAAQLPQVIECEHHTMGVESVHGWFSFVGGIRHHYSEQNTQYTTLFWH